MTLEGWAQILLFFLLVLALAPPLGGFLHRVLEGERHFLQRPLGWLERLLLRLERHRRPRAVVAGVLARPPGVQRLHDARDLRRSRGSSTGCRWNPQGFGPVEAGSAFNTAVSFTTNTNWQAYAGEATMSYLTPDGGARLAQLHLRGHRHRGRDGARARAHRAATAARRARSATSGWTSCARRSTSCCPLSLRRSRWCWSSQGVIQNLAPYAEATTLEGATQTIALGPVASQEAIKKLGTNGGGFFNANAAHPFENPTPLTQPPRDARDLRDPGRPHLHLRPHGEGPRGRAGRSSRRWRCSSSPGVGVAYWAEAAGNPILAGDSAVAPGRRQHGGQGGPLRHRQLRALRDRHHRRLLRRRQRHARQLHAARRPGAARQHPARRGRSSAAWARGSTACSSWSLLAGLHRRPDGRPHAGVPGQEDRDARGEDGDALRARLPARRSCAFAAWAAVGPYGAGRRSTTPGRTACPRSSTPSRAPPATTARAFAGLSANTPFYNVDARPRHADRPFPDDRPGPGDRRQSGRQEGGAARARARFPTNGAALRRCCSWPWS